MSHTYIFSRHQSLSLTDYSEIDGHQHNGKQSGALSSTGQVGPNTPTQRAILTPFYKKNPTNSGQNTSNTQRRTDYHQKRRENPKVAITIFGTYPSFFEYLTALVRTSGALL
jgi:hypothetical protein